MGHSYAHINELGYQAVRRAILPLYPQPRDMDGRFTSVRDMTTERLRSELQADNNADLEQAIANTRAETEEYFTQARRVRG